MTLPNGFDGAWNPICPDCGGYMHAGHKPDCPVTLWHKRQNERLIALIADATASSQGKGAS